jgi:hypothetical protein
MEKVCRRHAGQNINKRNRLLGNLVFVDTNNNTRKIAVARVFGNIHGVDHGNKVVKRQGHVIQEPIQKNPAASGNLVIELVTACPVFLFGKRLL